MDFMDGGDSIIPLGFPVNNVEEKCILNTTKGFMARSTELKITSKQKRTGRFLPGFSYRLIG
jgi:hypothetical protein